MHPGSCRSRRPGGWEGPFPSSSWFAGRMCSPLLLLCPKPAVTSFSPSRDAGSQLASQADTQLSAAALARLTSQYLACV